MTLKDVLEEICAEEYALPANAPAHRFKRRHRRAVNAVLYPDGLPKTKRGLPLKRRGIVIAAIIALAVVTGAAANYYRLNGFEFHKERDDIIGEYYVMLVENKENAPITIEKIIYGDNMPDDFIHLERGPIDENNKLDEPYINNKIVANVYLSEKRTNKFGDNGVYVCIEQLVKGSPVTAIVDECVTPVEVKGCKGFAITSEKAMNVVVWDSGDYIHVVHGTATIEELLEIAENMIEK